MRRAWKKVARKTAGIVAAAVLSVGWLAAQAPADSSAPPMSNEVVARLSAMSGTVSTSRSDTAEWNLGALNTPLLAGDKVAAGDGARAEVQLDYADIVRLGSNAQINLATLDKNNLQVQVAAGLVDYVVLKDARAASEINTPNLAVHPEEAGVYRVDVISGSETQVIVRKGRATISTPQGSTSLHAGQLITVEGVEAPQYKIGSAPPEDAFDRWNQTRDRRIEDAKSRDYTNQYYVGVQSLDGYGYWTVVPGYGRVWVPNGQTASWAPYTDGGWVWEPGWGWTWVSSEPWGWAPYHYGRWFVYGANWVWWPGPVTPFYRPIWAPAYVSFFGFGGGFGFGIGFGSIGWLPIGPCDPFHPWWGHGGFYGNHGGFYGNRRVVAPLAMARAGRVRYSNLGSMMTNERIRRAVVRVPSAEFGRGGMRDRSHVTTAELRRGSVLRGTVPVTPTRASLTISRRVSANAVPRGGATHFFGARGTMVRGTQARPNFTQEQHRVENSIRDTRRGGANARPGSTLERGQSFAGPNQDRSRATGARAAAPQRRALGPGWQRFGNGGRGAAPAARPESRPTPSAAPRPQGNGGAMQNRGARSGLQHGAVQRGSLNSSPSSAPRAGWQRFSHQPSAGPIPGARAAADGGRGFSPEQSRGRGLEGMRGASGPRPQYQHPYDPGYRSRPAPRQERAPVEHSAPRMERPPLQVGHPIVQSRGSFGGFSHGDAGGGRVFRGGGGRGRR